MKTSEVVQFLERVIEEHGDLDVVTGIKPEDVHKVTGFWTRVVPRTGKRVLIIAHQTESMQRQT